MILVIDYGMGNLRSVEKALTHVGASVRVSSDPADIARAERVVLPGVGAFDHAVIELKKRGLFEPLAETVRAGKSFLGLCLGLQLLFESSDEGKEKGFGVLRGRVKRFAAGLKVPHMGWNTVETSHPSDPIWKDIPSGSFFYFVHSYFADPSDDGLVEGSTHYGNKFCSVIRRGRILATQFHPEKSQGTGLTLLRNWVESSS